jgi:hypothetical protein
MNTFIIYQLYVGYSFSQYKTKGRYNSCAIDEQLSNVMPNGAFYVKEKNAITLTKNH